MSRSSQNKKIANIYMSAQPRKISEQSAREIREHIRQWISKFGRLDKAIVEMHRRRIFIERQAEELKEKYSQSASAKERS